MVAASAAIGGGGAVAAGFAVFALLAQEPPRRTAKRRLAIARCFRVRVIGLSLLVWTSVRHYYKRTTDGLIDTKRGPNQAATRALTRILWTLSKVHLIPGRVSVRLLWRFPARGPLPAGHHPALSGKDQRATARPH